ncbi:nuclear transport factor 2 family protein [Microbacterium oxydans]|uniref:nuclear transport factor 2 family protein n=1 Tax=Microbacterium TaxID=33882 RepID=UPI00076A3EB8|nr:MULTISPECIES: nuclear transport factor 2 family protein [Microbacterium]KAB1889674.1 nuclear transport factor 2 family protein [Microbacterium oxydans]GED40047.1 ketosteroid isomerase [Microbacterium oxydans]
MSAIDVVGQYGAAMAAGDMEALAATFHPDAVWHQPGANQLSGDHVGPDAIIAHLGRFMQLSGGTFALETESATESGALVSATVRFRAQRVGHDDHDQHVLDQHGVDVFRVADGRIVEVWLMSEDQEAEDRFWGTA